MNHNNKFWDILQFLFGFIKNSKQWLKYRIKEHQCKVVQSNSYRLKFGKLYLKRKVN